MKPFRWALAIGLGVLTLAACPTRRPVRAQAHPSGSDSSEIQQPPDSAARRLPVEQALLRPARLPFGRETSLEDVVAHLQTSLKAPVVLDLAALKRRELTPESTVRLDLDGVRLKTSLALLLDQVGLTYRSWRRIISSSSPTGRAPATRRHESSRS